MAPRDSLHSRVAWLEPEDTGGERIGLLGPAPLPVLVDGEPAGFDWYVFSRLSPGEPMPEGRSVSSALVYGDLGRQEIPLVRLHSACHTGDLFGSMRCDCGPQLLAALRAIVAEGSGVLLYISEHEGRGIGLWAKAMAYMLQDQGLDTYQANRELGLPDDARRWADAARVLARLVPQRRVRLLSNNPGKKAGLEENGFQVVDMVRLVAGANEVNQGYLQAKMRFGHLLGPAETGVAVGGNGKGR